MTITFAFTLTATSSVKHSRHSKSDVRKSETELNRTQLNGFRSIGSGKRIQSKPKASPSKHVFIALFLLFIQ